MTLRAALGGAALFACGVWVGGAVARPTGHHARCVAARPTAPGVERVRGDVAAAPNVRPATSPARVPSDAAPETRLPPSARREGRRWRGSRRPAGPTGPELSPERVAQRALRITAFVRGSGYYGAGVVIDRAGYVLTCLHVVQDMKEIEVQFSDGGPEPARVVDRDEGLDLAVLKLPAQRLAQARLASIVGVHMADPVFAMGAPDEMRFSISRGIVSYPGRRMGDLLYLQTDLATNGGSSGGPVLDDRGRVVALSSFILRDTQGLAFALPIDYAYRRFRKYFGDTLDGREFAAWLDQARTQ